MKFSGVLPDLNQAAQGYVFQSGIFRLMRCDAENVKVVQLIGSLGPQRLECADRIAPAVVEEIAEAEQIASLLRIGDLLHDRLKRRYRPRKIILPEVDETDIQANSGCVGRKFLSFLESR